MKIVITIPGLEGDAQHGPFCVVVHGVAVVAVDGGLEHEDLQWLKILGNKNPEGCIGRLFYKTEKKNSKIFNHYTMPMA